jgi:hypothetical protein
VYFQCHTGLNCGAAQIWSLPDVACCVVCIECALQTRDNVEQLRFVAPPVKLLGKSLIDAEGTCAGAAAAAATPGDTARPAAGSALSRAPHPSLVRGQSVGAAARATAVPTATSLPPVAEAAGRTASLSGEYFAADETSAVADTEAEPSTWLSPEYFSSPPGHTCAP